MHDASFASHIHDHHPCRTRTRGERIAHGILWGGAFTTAGVLFLLEHLGYLGGYHALSFWPAILVIAGVGLMTRRFRRLFGAALAIAGGLLLAWTLALAPLEWGIVWPVLVIVFGLFLILKMFTRRQPCVPHPGFAHGGVQPGAVIMGSKVDRIDSQEYEGGTVSTVMGSYLLDLTHAEIKGERATVVAKSVMGGIEIRVPTHWRVEVRSSPVMGGVDNRACEPEGAAKTLVVQAEVVLGGIEIRN